MFKLMSAEEISMLFLFVRLNVCGSLIKQTSYILQQNYQICSILKTGEIYCYYTKRIFFNLNTLNL